MGNKCAKIMKDIPPFFRSFRQDTVVFIDGANLFYSQKSLQIKIDYKKLYTTLHYYKRIKEVRIYLAFSKTSTKDKEFLQMLRDMGYIVIAKRLKLIYKNNNTIVKKGNVDIELALDAYKMRKRYRTIVLFSGDSDFEVLFRELKQQSKRCIFVSTKGHAGSELFNIANNYIDLKKFIPFIKKSPQ